jgi:pimeloyl-ACP methyl ester carboxylesterase
MTILKAHEVGPARLDIAYERLGDRDATPVLLLMGLGSQLIAWPDGFCDALLRHGLQLIRFDNRDVGESTHVTGSYTLSDMAGDAVGLLDALELASAHLVGVSMGGFIAQTIAIEHPGRVRSLTSMLSSTGDRADGQLPPEAQQLFVGMPTLTREDAVNRMGEVLRVIGSPAYPPDPAVVAERTRRAFDRAFDPLGMARQGMAVLASPDRTQKLRELHVPALVIHGAADKMVDVSGGRATAAAIPGAELIVIEGMGHDLPPPLWPQFADKIAATIARGEKR